MIFKILILQVILYLSSSSVGATRCSKIVQIESKEVGNYLGNVTFKVPMDFIGNWHLILKTGVPFSFFGGWGIRFKTDPTNKMVKVVSKESVDLVSGDRITFRFRVYWASNGTIPLVNSIVWQGRDICTEYWKAYYTFPRKRQQKT